ncbi:MAG: hypothetical protein ACI9JK_000580 [Phycisphaerales bacterium]|jgi:hypothetical protein
MTFTIFLISIAVIAIWSVVLATLLQLAFKIVLGQRNTFKDAYRICFITSLLHFLISEFLPSLLGAYTFLELAGPILAVCIMTYFIAKEIGNVKTSLVIALVLEGITFLLFVGLVAFIVAIVVGSDIF